MALETGVNKNNSIIDENHGNSSSLGGHSAEEDLLSLLADPRVLVANQVEFYSIMTLVPIGFILNILSFIIFYQIKRHKSAPGSHIMCMAVADNCALLGIVMVEVELSRFGYRTLFDIAIKDLHIFPCKFSLILVNGSALWSGLLLASATVERYCCIAYPLKVKTWNLAPVSKILNVLYFFVSFGLNIPLGYSYISHRSTEFNESLCVDSNDVMGDVTDIVVNGVLSHIVILTVIMIFTVAIAFHLRKTKNNRKTLSQHIVNQGSKEFIITSMLFAIACLFIATRLPIVLLFESARYLYFTGQFNLEVITIGAIAWPPSVLLLLINHSVNFVIYVIFFKEFRDRFVSIMLCKKPGRVSNMKRSSTRISVVTTNLVTHTPEVLPAIQ